MPDTHTRMSKASDSTVFVDGIEVKFPYEPYSSQKLFMESVIRAVREGKNALLESPTGTGKTLSLICSTLACILANKNNRIKLEPGSEDPKAGSADQTIASKISSLLAASEGDLRKMRFGNPNKVNVIYTSRTHSQLKQVISELKKSAYSNEFRPKGLRAALLASRDLLCVNPTRGNLSGEHLNNFCRALVQSRKCGYFNTFKGPKVSEEAQFTELVDIEDMVRIGKNGHFCPYFAVKDAQERADLILVPYNYLLSSTVREAMDLRIKNAIVIIDEAHNVESVAESASSFFIKQTDIAKYIDTLKRFAIFHRDLVNGPDKDSLDGIDINFTVLLNLGLCLKNTDDFLAELTLLDPHQSQNHRVQKDRIGEHWCVKEIARDHVVYSARSLLAYFYNQLQYSKLKDARCEETLSQLLTLLSRGVTDSDTLDQTFLDHYDDKTLKEDILIVVMLKKFVASILSQELMDFPDYYNVIVTNDDKYDSPRKAKPQENKVTHGWNKKIRPTYSQDDEGDGPEYRPDVVPKVLSFECLQPIPTFVRIKRDGIRTLILTSGTLGPLDALEKHIGGDQVKFEVKLQNDHVIDPGRVWAGIVGGNAQDPKILYSTFNTRNNADYISALGKALLTFLNTVPSGVLVFFGSYSVMNNTLNWWKKLGVYSKIEMAKSVFVETRPSSNAKDTDIAESTQSLFARYKESIDSGRGAVFFAICRGRMAEGIDFSDNYCRGIFLCGIPYPNRYEDTTALKMDYLDKISAQSGQKASLSNEWYTTQAIKAINQAIGRSIRHIEDYGAIMLADYRFQFPPVKTSISKWVLNRLTVYRTIDDSLSSLNSFFSKFHTKRKAETTLVKKEIPDARVPIKLDSSLQFMSRDTARNVKLKAMPVQSYKMEPTRLQREYGNSITNYLVRTPKSAPIKPDPSKEKGDLSFKSLNNWNFT